MILFDWRKAEDAPWWDRALRATDPALLATADDPVGPLNDEWIRRIASEAELTVACWGAWPTASERPSKVLTSLKSVHCLGRTKSGEPKHPLYLRADTPLQPYCAPVDASSPQ